MSDLTVVVDRLAIDAEHTWPPRGDVARDFGVEPISETSSHFVCRAEVEGSSCCLKVFRSWARGEPDREWTLLRLLKGSGFAPLPVWRSSEGSRPTIVTTWVEGQALRNRKALEASEVDAIAIAHGAIHGLVPPPSMPLAINAGAVVVERVVSWWPELPGMAADLGLAPAVQARLAGEPFSSTNAVASLIQNSRRVVCRGDTNLANYLISGSAVRLVDFEDSGLAEPVFELADMAEHFANRALPEDGWRHLAYGAGIRADDLRTARGVVAEFWFALTIRRNARGLATRPPVSAEEQLDRIAALGAAPS